MSALRIPSPPRSSRAVMLASTLWVAIGVACSGALPDVVAPEPVSAPMGAAAADTAVPEVLASNMLADIEYLASNELAGRYTLNDDIHRAADWIGSRFRSLGLAPVGTDYVVPYPLVTAVRSAGEHAMSVVPPRGRTITLGADDFEPATSSSAGDIEGEVVFVGYAVSSADVGGGRAYDDLAGIDVQGKVALALLDAPAQPDFWSLFSALGKIEERFDADVTALGETPAEDALTRLHERARKDMAAVLDRVTSELPPAFWQTPSPPTAKLGLDEVLQSLLRQTSQSLAFGVRSTRVSAKTERLLAAGAKGVIFVRGPHSFLSDDDKRTDELPSLDEARRRGLDDSGAVVMFMKWKQAERAFRIDGKRLSAVQAAIDGDKTPRSQALTGTVVRMTAAVERQRAQLPNVVAMLPGTDLADEVVVMGAHFDHVGYAGEDTGMCRTVPGPDGRDDSVCNGADDNASGTAMVLEMARIVASAPTKPRRTMMFVLFSGEELGLLGSAGFVAAPPYDLSRTVAMLNLDMVGRLDPARGLAIGGVGSSSAWMPLLDQIGSKGVYTIYDRAVVSRSDHANFYEHQIPVLFLFTGIHDDYHRAGDHADKINVDGMQRIGDLARDLVLALGSGHAVPYVEPREGEGLVGALPGDDPTTIEKRVGEPAAATATGS